MTLRPATRTEGDFDGLGELIHAAANRFAGVHVIGNLLGCHISQIPIADIEQAGCLPFPVGTIS
jgi:hypothetical protein